MPIVTAMLGAPKVKDVRASRTSASPTSTSCSRKDGHLLGAFAHHGTACQASCRGCRRGSDRTRAGRDRVGWVFQYALVDTTGQHSLADPRSYQDWYLRYYLKSVPGVAEVAPLGGFVRQYQVQVDPKPAADVQPAHLRRAGRRAGGQQRRRRTTGRDGRRRAYGSRPQLRQVHGGHRRHR